MKTKFLLFAFLAMVTLSVSAQSDNYSNYLNKALSSIENGDCEAAKKWYNVYKDLSGKTVSSVEALIQDCTPDSANSTIKKYAINDKIIVDDLFYRVAYIEDGGLHGFAIYDFGAGPLTDSMIYSRKVPTRAEMKLIAKNADVLKLLKKEYYWTIDLGRSNFIYYIYRLSNGHTKEADKYDDQHGRLLIYRF